MIDEREIIERAVQLLQPEEHALERMLRRRDRKRRSRRVRALVAASAAAALVVASLGLFDRNERTGPVSTPSPPIAEWVHRAAPEGFATAVASYAGNVYVGAAGHTTDRELVSAYDSQGHRLWAVRYSGVEVGGLAVDGSGVYVGSYSSSGLTKYDLDGTEVWSRSLRGTGVDARVTRLAMDGSGLYAYRGATTLQKYDRDGTLLWSDDLGSALKRGWTGYANSMVTAPSGGVYLGFVVCQRSLPQLGCGDGPPWGYDLLRIDADGQVLWSTTLPAPPGDSRGPLLAADAGGVTVLTSSLACGGREGGRRDGTCMSRFDLQGHRIGHVDLPPRIPWHGGGWAGFVLALDHGGVLIGRTDGSEGSIELLTYDVNRALVSSRTVDLGSGYVDPTSATTDGRVLAIAAVVTRHNLYNGTYPLVASLPLSGSPSTDG